MSPVSACASKWIIETRPKPRCRATPVASGSAIEWSPPRTSGTAPGRGDGVHRLLEVGQRALDLARRHLDVAGVDHGEVLERVDPQGQCGRDPSWPQVVGLPDRLRAEAGAGAVAGAAVERCPTTTTSARAERLGVVQIDPVDAEEGDVGAELGAVPRHDAGRVLPLAPRTAVRGQQVEERHGVEGLGAEHAGARPGAGGEQLEGDDRVDRGLPDHALGAVLAPSTTRCRPRGTGTSRAAGRPCRCR